MSNYGLYAHGGSANHGCEAIVRSIIKLLSLNKEHILCSNAPTEDIKYQLNELITITKAQNGIKTNFIYKLKSKLSSNPDRLYYNSIYHELPQLLQNTDIALSIGGDNYCYSGLALEMSVLLSIIRQKTKASPILLGCSIESKEYKNYLETDFKKYEKIIARESITYSLLNESGLKNIFCIPDPAFQLNRKDLPLPTQFTENNTVGINVSPMIIGYENQKGITLQNYIELIAYILHKTDMQIALIPHVVWINNDDRKPLQILFNKFKDTGRICMITDHNAEELKGYIARCRFMIAARTHASIAAYSQQVPTLVVGYSVKAKGIATDIFGTDRNYVIPVQELTTPNKLKDAFISLMAQEKDIKNYMNSFIPEYNERCLQLKEIIS